MINHRWFDIPCGTPVSVALGDLQCSVMSTLEHASTDVVMNVSTSAQMAFVMPKGFNPRKSSCPPAAAATCIEYLPYLDGHYIAAAAALTGNFTRCEVARHNHNSLSLFFDRWQCIGCLCQNAAALGCGPWP